MHKLSRFLATILVSCAPFAVHASDCADLSLVLAIDSSSSIDKTEFQLQLRGYAAAFASHEVQDAIAQAGIVDVAMVFWGDSEFGFQVVPWTRIATEQSSESFAASILATHRKIVGDTDIGDGLAKALDLLELPGRCAARSVVNVSGDGRASLNRKKVPQVPITEARARAARMGVVVNGLAVTNAEAGLVDYYRDEIIVGPGAFVIEATDFAEFKEAILLKLVREIGPTLSASLEVE